MLRNLYKNTNRIKKIIKNYLGFYNEDIEQEVYIKVWKNQDKYNEQNKFTSWVSTITANLCKDYLKSTQHKISSNSTSDENIVNNIKYSKTPDKILTSKERQKIILKEIDALPKKMKQAIVLYEFEDFSYEQISKKLNIPTGTVKSRINNARKILSDKLSYLLEDKSDE